VVLIARLLEDARIFGAGQGDDLDAGQATVLTPRGQFVATPDRDTVSGREKSGRGRGAPIVQDASGLTGIKPVRCCTGCPSWSRSRRPDAASTSPGDVQGKRLSEQERHPEPHMHASMP
jgi:hypothetical protein